MASIMENLMDVLEKEQSLYDRLLDLSMKKTSIIIAGDVDALTKITDDEQEVVSSVNRLDKERESLMREIAAVLNKDVQTLTLNQLIPVLNGRTEEQRRLSRIHDRLKLITDQMRRVNDHNKELIEASLEMVQYNMNVVKSMKAAPETANYGRNAYGTGSMMGSVQKSFDTKQ